MSNPWSSAMTLALVATTVFAGTAGFGEGRPIVLAPSDPAAVGHGDQLMPGGTHLDYYSFNATGAKSIGLSVLDGPSYPITPVKSAEIFYVYDGSGIITQANGHDVAVRKGDIVFVPRGVAYGGKNFVHYKHAFLVFDPGKEPVSGGPSEVTVLHPNHLGSGDFETQGAQRVHVYYRGEDGSTIRVWQTRSAVSESSRSQVAAAEYTIVLKGSIVLTSGGHTMTARAGDVFFVPSGVRVSYSSRNVQALTVESVAGVRDGP